MFQAENCDILITGDLQAKGEAHLIRSVNLPEVEILVAGHHGADDSTTMALLKEVNPATVVISVGEENNFGPSGIFVGKNLYSQSFPNLSSLRNLLFRVLSSQKDLPPSNKNVFVFCLSLQCWH